MLKDAVSIPGISMTYVINKAIKLKEKNDPDLYSPGQPCIHKCEENCYTEEDVRIANKLKKDCELCSRNKAYEFT